MAEELIFKRISTGAANDIKQATTLAHKMIRTFGMSDSLAPLSYENHDQNIFIGREMTQAKAYSEETARKIDAEVALIIDRAYQAAKKILEENTDILHALTDLLMERETVLGCELDELISYMRPDFDFFGKKIKSSPISSISEIYARPDEHRPGKAHKTDGDNVGKEQKEGKSEIDNENI